MKKEKEFIVDLGNDSIEKKISWYKSLDSMTEFKFLKKFKTTNPSIRDRIGQPFTVVRRSEANVNYYFEGIKETDPVSVPQWKIRFEDGKEMFALPDEVLEYTDES